ncbi:MAG: hypothetical protein Q7T50_04340 [Candidatus Magasanikbacteria bacterium]|nr:hypothetical protein [Candidatus Magasanikbacteria bacterium]
MSIKGIKSKKNKIIALVIFVILGFLALQLPINNLAGSGAKFTLFDLFAPVSGAFLGTPFGIAAVFLMQIVNLAFGGFTHLDKGVVIRLFPILFGALFFSRVVKKNSTWLLLIPFVSIVSFNLNPVGRSVWYFSMFWTIPFLVYPFVKKSLVARSLSSTFVAHSVGGAIWIWAFNLPAVVWQGLIPVIAFERGLMALGICASYILLNNLVALAKNNGYLSRVIVNKDYVFNLLKH